LDIHPTYKNTETFLKDRRIIMNHLQENKEMTAAFAINYKTALLLRSAVEEIGLVVPDDFSIVCFDSPVMEIPGTYYFTHMQQREDEVGQKAFDLLCTLMQGESNKKSIKIEVAAKIITGNSTKQNTHAN